MATGSFVLDSSAILDLFNFFPVSHMDTLTPLIAAAVKKGKLFIPEVVYDEITRLEKHAKVWATRNSHLFVPENKIIVERGGAIHNQFRPLVKQKQKDNSADPYVIAYAEHTNSTVVTHEKDSQEIKIPYVCKQLGIECIRFPELADRFGWTPKWS